MDDPIDQILGFGNAIASRGQLVRALGRHRFDHEVRSGRLEAVFPRIYARPWFVDDPQTRRHAALASVGGDVALSHLTALELFDLVPGNGAPLHVTAYQPRHPRGVAGELVVHRTLLPLDHRMTGGLPVVRLETALTTSWPLLAGTGQRAPVIAAARRRLLAMDRLTRTVGSMWWVAGSRDLRRLVGQIAAGCESELELWGYLGVFDVPGLRDAQRQFRIRAGDKSYRLDMAYKHERLAVELDGRAYHASPAQWERDIARDLALATHGWQTIRLSHQRLTTDVAGCRRDVLAVRAARRGSAQAS